MSLATEHAQAELSAIVGASRVVTDAETCTALTVDGKTSQCVVYPESQEELAAVLRCGADHELGMIPCRNGTKLSVGNLPRRYDVALSLKDMNRVWHYEPPDLTITVEPGMEFGDFQHFVGRDGLWLPLDPPGGARSSLGGIVATNAAGPLRLAYGAPRDIVLGMKIATTEGKVLKAGGRVVKNVTGYDIGKLLIGSYGTLGVIVEISLKLFPLPPQRATFAIPVGTLGIGRDLRRRILQSPLTPARMVMMDAAGAQHATAGSAERSAKEPELWLEMAGSTRLIERCEREVGDMAKAAGAAVRRVEPDRAQDAWGRITDLRAWVGDSSPRAVILKATLPDSASEELMSRAEQEATGEKAQLAAFAQLGVGVVRFCVLSDPAPSALVGLIRRLRDATQGLGGALIIECCPPGVKRELDVWGTPGDDFAVMRKIKETWDPKGVLSPGRSVGRV